MRLLASWTSFLHFYSFHTYFNIALDNIKSQYQHYKIFTRIRMQGQPWANPKDSNTLLKQDELQGSYDWREQQNQKTQYKNPKIKDLFPINYNTQMQRFLQNNGNYNPHFCYKTIVSPQLIQLNQQYQQLANKILINNKYQSSNLPILTQSQVFQQIQKYLQQLGLNQYVQIKFQNNCLSRTSISFYKQKAILKIRLPLQYNHINLQGVLHHEIGTHLVRRLNHKENCIRKPTQKGKLIQQGLAAINQLIPQEKPFLFKAALRYIAAIYASKMSFQNVYKMLSRFVKDKKDCWRETVRVKRGVGNTEEFGGYYKDQSYFVGAIEILKERKNIDFRKIFYGKLAPNQTTNLNNGVLPPFIDNQEKYRSYLKKLDAMAICNFID